MGTAGALPSLGSPFPVTTGPEQAVAHRGWAEARAGALSALLAGSRLVLVLGAPGTGKTLLLRDLARTLRAAGADAVLARGGLPIDEAAFGGGQRVVLIDEADRMDEAALESLARLGARAFVLAGGMPDPGDRQAAAVVRLAPLRPDEVGAFVAARLAQSGLGADILSGGALARLAEHSAGMPRMVDTLADAALHFARAERALRVEAVHIDHAVALWAEPLSRRLVASPGRSRATSATAPLGGRLKRRRELATVLCLAIGIAAACGGAWSGLQTRSTTPDTSVSPPVPVQPPGVHPKASQIAALAQAGSISPEPETLPLGAPAHVAMRYARGSADAAARAASLALTLRAAGFAVDSIDAVPRRAAKAGARYVFAEDQGTADAVLKVAGLPGSSSQATAAGLSATLRPGLIELTVPPGEVEAGGRVEPPSPGRT